MAEVIVRSAASSDIADIVLLRQEIVRDPVITFTTVEPDDADIRHEIESAFATQTPYLVADINGAAVGVATWKSFRGGPGYRFTVEHSIHLRSKARGSGSGRALMDALIAHASKVGIKTMVAGISGANTAGLSFHKHFGFTETGRMPGVGHKNGIWYDLILMQRTID